MGDVEEPEYPDKTKSEGATRDHDTQWPQEHPMDYPENANSLKRLVDLRKRVRSLSKRLDEAFEKYHSEKATGGEPQLPK